MHRLIYQKQKTIWMRFSIIGISVVLALTASRCKETAEPVKSVTYVYKNESGEDLEMYIRSYSFNNGKSLFTIAKNDSMIFIINSMSGKPFAGESISSEITDSVGI